MHAWLDWILGRHFFFYTLIEIWQECIIGVNINIFVTISYTHVLIQITTHCMHVADFFSPLAKRIVGIFLHHHPPVLHRIATLVYKCWESK